MAEKFDNRSSRKDILNEGFQYLLGSYALSDKDVIDDINNAYTIVNLKDREKKLAIIAADMTRLHDGLMDETAHEAIQSYQKNSEPFMELYSNPDTVVEG